MTKEHSLDDMPGKLEKRVFIGGNYDLMPILLEIKKIVRRVHFCPILAHDFNVPPAQIHDYDLRLLHNCRYAIFDVSSPAGELMELERTRDYRTIVCVVYQVRDERRLPPSQLSSMVTTFGSDMHGYLDFTELEGLIKEFLCKPKMKEIQIGQLLKRIQEAGHSRRKSTEILTSLLERLKEGQVEGFGSPE